jgi:acyl-CoA synthetase (AMP-forming)/AMP-acid ligase II
MLWKSPYADANIPDAPLTSVVLERATALGDKPALVCGVTGRRITYAELSEGVRRVARGLADRGFGPGDVLGLYSPNLPEYALAVFGVASLGGTVTPANPLYTVDELAQQLEDAGAKVLITAPPFLEKARAAASRTGVKEVLVFGEADGALPFASLLRSNGEPPAVEIVPREDVAVLPYSSGTTGRSKGVMLTHYNLVSNIFQCVGMDDIREEDVVIAVLPFFHIYGLSVLLNMTLYHGCTLVTLPRFELEPFLKALQDHMVTRAYVVPPIILGLAKHPVVDTFDLRNLRCITSGAAPLGAEVQGALARRLRCIVKQGYGLTETSPVTHTNPDDGVRLGASGLLIRNTECRIVDPGSGADLGAGERGELWVRGPQVMKGYLNDPSATRATITPEGWLRTGDIGCVDADGFLFVVDRLKELIKYKGMQVAPAELEALLLTHPAVADAAVIGSPDAEAGEVPKAFVVLKGEATPDELMALVAERVAPHKKIRLLEIVEQIPKSPAGKILRRILVERERLLNSPPDASRP